MVRALGLTLFHFQRRHNLLAPGVHRLFGLLHSDGGGTDVAHDLCSDCGVLATCFLDFSVGATDPTLVAREQRHIQTHAGTELDASGRLTGQGGRVLDVVALGEGLAQARDRAYRAVAAIRSEGLRYREDIAADALAGAPDRG